MTIHDLSTRQYYKGLSRRFDSRVRLLARLGFRYTREAAGFPNDRPPHCWTNPRRLTRYGGIVGATIMHADSRAWTDTLLSNCRRPSR